MTATEIDNILINNFYSIKMSKNRNTLTNVYVPQVSTYFKFLFSGPPDPDKEQLPLYDEENEMMEKIPKGILDGWTWNRRYIACLELFQIQDLDQESIILELGINTPSYRQLFEEIKERNGKRDEIPPHDVLVKWIDSQVKNEVFELHQDF